MVEVAAASAVSDPRRVSRPVRVRLELRAEPDRSDPVISTRPDREFDQPALVADPALDSGPSMVGPTARAARRAMRPERRPPRSGSRSSGSVSPASRQAVRAPRRFGTRTALFSRCAPAPMAVSDSVNGVNVFLSAVDRSGGRLRGARAPTIRPRGRTTQDSRPTTLSTLRPRRGGAPRTAAPSRGWARQSCQPLPRPRAHGGATP